jgi:hypothetical protein
MEKCKEMKATSVEGKGKYQRGEEKKNGRIYVKK